MSMDLLIMAVLAGLANWGFRALPTILMRNEPKPGGVLAKFLASTGPAAIATLFVASAMSELWPEPKAPIALICGVVATIAGFLPRRSVVAATMLGSAAYGLAFATLQ